MCESSELLRLESSLENLHLGTLRAADLMQDVCAGCSFPDRGSRLGEACCHSTSPTRTQKHILGNEREFIYPNEN